MKHLTIQEAFGMPARRLAEKIGDLRYDAARDLFSALSEKFKRDAVADRGRGRPILAQHLVSISHWQKLAMQECASAWRISEPHMKK